MQLIPDIYQFAKARCHLQCGFSIIDLLAKPAFRHAAENRAAHCKALDRRMARGQRKGLRQFFFGRIKSQKHNAPAIGIVVPVMALFNIGSTPSDVSCGSSFHQSGLMPSA